MTSALLIHDTSVTIAEISITSAGSKLDNLSFPSRFPKDHPPVIATSPSGHFFLYTTPNSHIIWEYDSRGKRTSEISLSGETTEDVCPLGRVEGKETVLIALKEDNKVRVMEKVENKWKCIKTLEGPKEISRLITDGEGRNVLVIGRDETVSFDRESGTRRVLQLPIMTNKGQIAFVPNLRDEIVYPNQSGLNLFDISSGAERQIRPFGEENNNEVESLTFSPLVGSGEKRKGGLCAVCRKKSTSVVLIGLDKPGSLKTIDFGEEVSNVRFLDGATLVAISVSGQLLVKNLRTLNDPPLVVEDGKPVLAIHPVIAKIAKIPHRSSSLAGEPNSNKSRTPLGDKEGVTNICFAPAISSLPSALKGKARDLDPIPEKAGVEDKEKVRRTARVVSAPVGDLPSKMSNTNHTQPAKCSRGTSIGIEADPAAGSRSRRSQPRKSVDMHEGDITVSWALDTPANRQVEQVKSGYDNMEEMKREIGNLQIDLLRMGRSLRNEIKLAVQPLLHELEENRRLIQAQREEIERLRAR